MRAIWSADNVGKVASGRSTRNCGVDMTPDSERSTASMPARPGGRLSLGTGGGDPDIENADRGAARPAAVLHLAAHPDGAGADRVDRAPHQLRRTACAILAHRDHRTRSGHGIGVA